MNSFLALCLVTVWSVNSIEGRRTENIGAQKNVLSARLWSRITGGKEVKPHSVPWQAFIVLEKNFNITGGCGGSLLTIGTVITAGHCCTKGNTRETQVILGAHNITKSEPTQQLIDVKRIALHEKYGEIIEGGLPKNDICILFLKKNATLNEVVQPVKLPSLKDADKDFAGRTAIASGWGLQQYEPAILTSVLQMVELPILSNDECQKKFNANPELHSHLTITPKELCTYGQNGHNTCRGDSGGPLTVTDEEGQPILVGLFSTTMLPCELTLGPSTYTRVTKYLDWIAKTAHTDIAE